MARFGLTSWIVVVLAMLTGVTPSRAAVPLTEHVPASPVLYVGWRGADAAGDAYAASKLKAVVEDAGLIERWGPMMAALLDAAETEAAADDPEAAEVMAELEAFAPVAWRRPWVLFIDRIDLDAEAEDPGVWLGFVVDAGPMRDTASAAIDRLIEAASAEDSDLPIRRIEREGVIGFTIGKGEVEPGGYAADAWAGGSIPVPMLAIDVDLATPLRQFEERLTQEDDDDARRLWSVMEKLGLADLDALTFAAGFDGPRWRSVMHLGVPAPRTGLWPLLEGEPLADDAWGLVPETASWARLFRFDAARLMPLLRDILSAVGPESIESFDDALAQAPDALGFDVERDLLDTLGDTWAIYSEPTFATGLGPGIAIVHPLRDADRLAQTLVTLREKANARMAEMDASFQIAPLDMGNVTVDTLAFPFLNLSWTVADGHFYMAMSPAAVSTAYAAVQDPARSLASNEKCHAARARLMEPVAMAEPAGLAGAMFVDLEATAPRIYPTYAMLLNLASGPIMQETGLNALNLLPPLGAMLEHLEPAAAATWFDETGLHYAAVSPFPGSTMLSPEVTWSYTNASVPMAVGIMLPALGAARQSAQELTSNTQMRGIHQSMVVWSEANEDEGSPTSLFVLLEGDYFTPEYMLSPSAPVELPDDFDAWPAERREAWTQQHASYVIIPWEEITLDSTRVTLFEKPDHSPSDRTIGLTFDDNATARTPHAEARLKVRRQTGFTIEQWIEAAERGDVPEGFDPSGPREPTPPPAPQTAPPPAP